jgi:4-hydroxy-3-methylbut-2-en-1-yl diphosphate synthase IspG/GcpE
MTAAPPRPRMIYCPACGRVFVHARRAIAKRERTKHHQKDHRDIREAY